MPQKIVVFGSFVVDLTSRAGKLPVPGETVMGSAFKLGPGGKGSNQAVAAHRAGADVTLVTKVGKDVFGQVARDFYVSEGMDTRLILEDKAVETGTALIMVDDVHGQNMILVVSGACGHITDADIKQAEGAIDACDILLLQLEINLDALAKVMALAHARGKRIILNTAPAQHIPDSLLAMADIVTPNESEAGMLTGIPVDNMDGARAAARTFVRKGVKNVVITMGSQGAYVTDGTREEIISPLSVNVVDTTGAGDAFSGGFATALADGFSLFDAARFGNVTGALAVTRKGTAPAMPYQEEIQALYKKAYGN
jgi:ribokinase